MIATSYGYFAEPTDDQDDAVAAQHPGLLSGIALAGANRGAEDEQTDDGVLTAMEVASLNLGHVELVVLSACETGLGTVIRGEGVLGLQRAFQMAGARTAVTSLWKIDDAATQTMMIEFYRQLWDQRLGKAEALRQTQLAMLRRYDPGTSKLRPRGLKLVGDDDTPTAKPAGLPPYHWAPFVLSGEWR